MDARIDSEAYGFSVWVLEKCSDKRHIYCHIRKLLAHVTTLEAAEAVKRLCLLAR